ncbi:MAG: type I glutamate--ammonia ligase [Gammaproteobacteria bacterium]|nr:type I glutamate--ammonia ligase [Gammaproteobacteria bacterium]MCY4210035.1 type I glutamate--ammonia ligase [Gammaproteobacteria bacterium]MCY4282429.1 type I glutamate--ammonia ligase [Gammaproteobacteria bacterium]MCY4338053.1 type I glutamate--ammonia ligase [Gammaproteobacteria bacterium]
MSKEKVYGLIEEHEVHFIDLRFCDARGKEQHVTVPASTVDDDFFENGKMFDGSSISGWKGINESDMLLMPDTATAVVDPFYDESTLNLRCDVLEPTTMQGYERCPRSLAKRAEAYLQSTGIADSAYFGPEPEFFIFDEARWGDSLNSAFYEIDSEEGHWNSDKLMEGPNHGHRPGVKGGYFPVPPVDSLQNVRSAICMALEDMGLVVEVHHHEVATGGQAEIGTKFNTLVTKADELLTLKYCAMNVAQGYGKTVTFMPKPLVGDNGNGMHVHQSLGRDGQNLFTGDKYGGLSDLALHYIAGIFKHARALNAFTNASTNSYKRLVPGFEAPVLLAYSARNRSASCRIPWVPDPRARRIEIRFPDSCGNPYFMFAAMMMAGLDGIQNRLDPGDPLEKDLYDLTIEEEKEIPTVCSSLDQALEALDQDREFLTTGGVFSDDMIDGYIELKMNEVTRFRMTTHPVELDMYYSL